MAAGTAADDCDDGSVRPRQGSKLPGPIRTAGVLAPATALLAAGILAGCGDEPVPDPGPPADRLRVEIVATRPHDPEAFTQGLEISDGELLEGTGRSGRSYLSARALDTGVERTRVPVPDDMFGEGITVAGDTVWQLTWKDGVAIARDRDTLTPRDHVEYDGQGWGVCAAGDRLVMSDGSSTLTFRDPATFDVLGSTTVRVDGREIDNLNELECAEDGSVYANVWQTDRIVRIDPGSGRVTATIDAGALRDALTDEQRAEIDVLNGIAQVPGTDRFLVTGKYWPTMFEVRFVP